MMDAKESDNDAARRFAGRVVELEAQLTAAKEESERLKARNYELLEGLDKCHHDKIGPALEIVDLKSKCRDKDAQLTAVREEIKECEEALDKSDLYLHEALDRLGVPSSKRFPGKARDGVIARVEDALAAANTQMIKLRKAGNHQVGCRPTAYSQDKECSCGWAQAIAESDSKEEK